MPLDLYRLNLLRRRAGGWLAERKRRTPREWRETSVALWAPNRGPAPPYRVLREARRAAALERGSPPPSAAIGAAYYPFVRDRIFSVWNQRAENAIPNRSINPLFR